MLIVEGRVSGVRAQSAARGADVSGANVARLDDTGVLAWIEQLLWATVIVLMTTPFTFWAYGLSPTVGARRNIVSMHTDNASQAGAYMIRALAVVLALIAVLPMYSRIPPLLKRMWPLLPFQLWALISVLWTDSVSGTLNGQIPMLGLYLVPLCLCVRLSAPMAARCMVLAGAVLTVLTLAFVVFVPSYGLHQVNDATQAVHAGSWRGSYFHKNQLGQISAMLGVAVFSARTAIVPSPRVKWGIFAGCVLMVIGSTSVSAVAIMPCALALSWFFVESTRQNRLRFLLYCGPALIGGYFAIQALLFALGRDMTFTGRTKIWEVVFSWFFANPVIGYGFNTVSYGGFAYELMYRYGVSEPHNAFFDVALSLGFIGLVFIALPIVLAIMRARALFAGGGVGREAARVFAPALFAWILADLTEISIRPFAATAGIGFFVLVMLLITPPPSPRANLFSR